MNHAVYWMRRDLRLHDNIALAQALSSSDKVTIIFIETPDQWQQHYQSPIQTDLMERRLNYLAAKVKNSATDFLFLSATTYKDTINVLAKFCNEQNIQRVFANKEYEWNEQQRDLAAETALNGVGVKLHLSDDKCLVTPGKVLTQQQTPFRVFSPFRRAWLTVFQQQPPTCFDCDMQLTEPASIATNTIELNFPKTSSQKWAIDDDSICSHLNNFIEAKVADYGEVRDFPAIDGTSNLSAYLATGMLSIRQCIRALSAYQTNFMEEKSPGFRWFNELIWRDFYQHLIFHFPDVCKNKPFVDWTKYIQWSDHKENLERWQQGKTGFPLVDAAMCQLKETGWMHNRLRMITASFLVKDLHIDWRHGERWFMENLIDGDFGANNGGWQWAASTGCDAQPYFRVFNPITQSEKFDKHGEFIRHWVPELASVPAKQIHFPHHWLNANNVSDYYPPIVDHAAARKHAISMFEKAKCAPEQNANLALDF